jgi:hypothetical protein
VGTYVAPSKTTVGEFLLRWLDYKRSTVSAKTFVRYEEVVTKRLIPDLGSIPLTKLAPKHILDARRTWAKHKQANGMPLAAQTLLNLPQGALRCSGSCPQVARASPEPR